MKRTKKRASMREDIGRTGWVEGWGGKVNRMNHGIQRAARKRLARREILTATPPTNVPASGAGAEREGL